jgi:hypothetical protein
MSTFKDKLNNEAAIGSIILVESKYDTTLGVVTGWTDASVKYISIQLPYDDEDIEDESEWGEDFEAMAADPEQAEDLELVLQPESIGRTKVLVINKDLIANLPEVIKRNVEYAIKHAPSIAAKPKGKGTRGKKTNLEI